MTHKAKIQYRSLHGAKYVLTASYLVGTGVLDHTARTEFIDLTPDGVIVVSAGYAWDGPSGPTFDTLSFMRGSLVHDAIYQLIRMELIPPEEKAQADNLLRSFCRADGMGKMRAWYVYNAVRFMSGDAAKPGSQKPREILSAP